MLELTLCNELLHAEGMSLQRQCEVAAALGYAGLELAPSTLGEAPHRLDADEREAIRGVIRDSGLRVTGLHWLLTGYPDLSITDPSKREETAGVLRDLVDLCADLDGDVLVHGSPKQRPRPEGLSDAELDAYLVDFFAPLAERAEARGVTYCIEPLATEETGVVNTVDHGVRLVEALGSPAFRTMIDCSAAGRVEPPVAGLIRDWVPTGKIAHIHANDTNRGGPGMGDDPFHEIVAALVAVGWDAPVGVEPFRTVVDASVTAGIAAATLRACERGLR